MAATEWKGKMNFQNQVAVHHGGNFLTREPQLFDHFVEGAGAINSAVPQKWVTTETGTGTSHAIFVPIATGASTVAGVAGGTTNNAQELAGKAVIWPASSAVNGPLVFETRLKVVGATTATDGDFAFGLADAVTYTSGLPYVIGASSLYTTEAPVEFAGFNYSSIPTSGTLFHATSNYIGVKTNISSAVSLAVSSGVQKDSAYHTYRVELDVLGNASFYIDLVPVGEVALAVTAATALTPYFNVVGKNSHANTMTIDYIFVGGERV